MSLETRRVESLKFKKSSKSWPSISLRVLCVTWNLTLCGRSTDKLPLPPLPKTAKPVWAKQLTKRKCLVVKVTFQFVHTITGHLAVILPSIARGRSHSVVTRAYHRNIGTRGITFSGLWNPVPKAYYLSLLNYWYYISAAIINSLFNAMLTYWVYI